MEHDGATAAPRSVLPASVVVLLTGTAVYFAGSAAAPALVGAWALTDAEVASLTWSVQAGFILGTVVAAGTGLADRFRPGRLIAGLLVAAAAANAGLVLLDGAGVGLVALRFLVGALAGPVYPIGMKFLATWYPRLGWELGVLLGAYTLGAGAASVLGAAQLPWQWAILGASALGLAGAAASLALLREGPLLPARSSLDVAAAARAFRVRDFRRSSLAYFGHMWELFAFWGLLPLWLGAAGLAPAEVAIVFAAVFVAGAAGCVLAGAWARRRHEVASARTAVAASGALCLASPWLFDAPVPLLVGAVIAWGAAVVADSPMFSSISARAAPRSHVGTALTAQNSIGFALTVVSISLVPVAVEWLGSWRWAFLLLAPGPLLALVPLARLGDA